MTDLFEDSPNDQKKADGLINAGHLDDVVSPCPFCGGKARVTSKLDSWDIKVYSIKCDTEGCIMHHAGVLSDYKGALIKAWNKRA